MIHKTIVIAIIFLAGQIIIPSFADAPEHLQPGVSPFAHGFTDIKFLDAYFGTSSGKIEVQPGDKNVPFTIVFSNVGSEDIAGIKGLLSLPVGFSSASANAGLIEADNTQVAASGQSFILTFFVNVDKNTNVHSYTGTVQVTYSRVRENGVHTNFFDFDFKVTGKSVLNLRGENPFLQPATNNQVIVQVSNVGTAPLSNVDIVLQNTPTSSTTGTQSTTNLENIVIDQNHWNIGTVAPQSTNSFSFKIFVPQSIADKTIHLPVNVTYFDGQGNQVTSSRTIDFIVGPASTASIIKISAPPYVNMGVMQDFTLGITNLSASKISDIAISLTPNSNDLKILEDTRWFVKEINPLEKTEIKIPIFADRNIEGQSVNFDVNLQYTKDGSTVIEKQNIATYILGLIDISVYGVNVMDIAGHQNIIGNILNQGNIKGQFATVTIESVDNSNIKKSFYYVGDLDTDAPVPFNVPIEFNGKPTFGEHKVVVTITYKDSLLQPHTLTQQETITLANPNPQTNDNSQIQLVILVAVAAGIGGIVFKIRKAKISVTKKVTENSS